VKNTEHKQCDVFITLPITTPQTRVLQSERNRFSPQHTGWHSAGWDYWPTLSVDFFDG